MITIYIIMFIPRSRLRVCSVSTSRAATLITSPTSPLDSLALVISVIDRDVVLLSGGNPMVSTTHIDLRDLAGSDFGAPMHLLIVPAGLHQMEAEALVRFAGAPEEIIER